MPREPSLGWWNDIARALFGYTEHETLTVEDEIRAAVILQNDRPEWGFVGQELWCGGANNQPGVAATRALIGLRNPRGSNVLAIIDGIGIADGAATIMISGRVVPPRIADAGRPTPTSTIPGTPRDTRWEAVNQRQATCVVIGATPAALFGFEVDRWLPTFQQGLPMEGFRAILAPGADYYLQTDNIASTIGGSFRWRERLLQSSGLRA